MSTTFIYLHGFLSSPDSEKARLLRAKLEACGMQLRVPDLNVPEFARMTLTAQIDRLAEEVVRCADGPVYLIAASMGAQVALHFMDRHGATLGKRVERIVLLAPSFDFVGNRRRQLGDDEFRHWKASGWTTVTRYDTGNQEALSYDIIDDMERYAPYPTDLAVPILVIHGLKDDVVDYRRSVAFAETLPNVTLTLVDSNHALSGQDDFIWSSMKKFVDLRELGAGDEE